MSQSIPSLTEYRRRRARRRALAYLPTPAVFLWAALGLELTLAGTLIRLDLPNTLPQAILWQWPPVVSWVWQPGYSFSLQLAAVLLTAVMGGPLAGLLAQVAYVGLGLWHYPIFFEGGGPDYLHHPSLGYLLGFLPAGWVVGLWANPQPAQLKSLVVSCLAGLLIIQVCGFIGLALHYGWSPLLLESLIHYGYQPLGGQVIGVLLASGLGWVVRKLFLN